VIQSPGEVLPESEIYFHLAKRLNLNISFELLPEPGNINIEKWLEKRISGYSELTLKELKKAPVIAPGLQQIAWEDLKFETPSGKIEIYSVEAGEKWGISPLPCYTPVNYTTDEKMFPLEFITPNSGSRIHSQFGNLNIIKETIGELAVLLSPDDARIRNITTGQKIKVYNRTGMLISKARISNRVQKGLVMLPNGLWLNEGGGGNNLIAGNETDIGFGAAFHDNRVEVIRVDD
jgi:anaerobic selenocysteine-containing dehydrogenase